MSPSKSVLIEQIEQLTIPVLEEHAANLVDLEFVHEYGRWVLRYFVEKAEGITLDDCADISDHLSRILDASNLISQSYALEVSSPGINRVLKKPQDYERFKGERADINLYAPLNGRRHFRGTIESVEGDSVMIRDVSQQIFALPLTGIAKAKLDPEIKI